MVSKYGYCSVSSKCPFGIHWPKSGVGGYTEKPSVCIAHTHVNCRTIDSIIYGRITKQGGGPLNGMGVYLEHYRSMMNSRAMIVSFSPPHRKKVLGTRLGQ